MYPGNDIGPVSFDAVYETKQIWNLDESKAYNLTEQDWDKDDITDVYTCIIDCSDLNQMITGSITNIGVRRCA